MLPMRSSVAPRLGQDRSRSQMALSLALCNAQRHVQLMLIDPKGRGLACLGGLPHLLCPPVMRIEQAQEQMEWLVDEMEYRDERRVNTPRLVVFIDELADLLMVGGKEMERLLARLSQRGREAGVHLIACTQKPTVAVLGSLTKATFRRLVGAVTSRKSATGGFMAGTGAGSCRGGATFCWFVKGQTTRFCAA